jgi:hypothetical protein
VYSSVHRLRLDCLQSVRCAHCVHTKHEYALWLISLHRNCQALLVLVSTEPECPLQKHRICRPTLWSLLNSCDDVSEHRAPLCELVHHPEIVYPTPPKVCAKAKRCVPNVCSTAQCAWGNPPMNGPGNSEQIHVSTAQNKVNKRL